MVMRTLSIDIGGTGIKATVLDAAGAPLTERMRMKTPRPATPDAVLGVVGELAHALGEFDRVSIGFPGVVHDGVTRTAPNLGPAWAGFLLQRRVEEQILGKPTRVANDATIQGLDVIERRGLEAIITLGTGLGCCLFVDGRPWELELGHHVFRKGKPYEAFLGNEARKDAGNARWNRRVKRALVRLDALFNYDRLYIGGGNAKHLDREGLPENVSVVDNTAGVLGGIRLWD
jgi:polyphosphate glucokinase